MSDSVYRRSTCRLCGSKDLALVLPLKPSPLADAYVPASELHEKQPLYPLDLYLCRSCGLAQLLDVIHPKVIYTNYIYETVSSLGLVDHFRGYADDVVARIKPRKDSLVIDIGSNDGTLLRFFREKGFKVLGIDPAREIARHASERGIETLAEFFTADFGRELKRGRGAAALVTANNVIANIDNLEDVITGVREVLAPDGVFTFESYYLADVMRNMVFDFIYHEHISSFSVVPLQRFFHRMGMELFDVQHVPTKGGSLRYEVQLAGGPRKITPAVREIAEAETKMGLQRESTFVEFAGRIKSAKEKLQALLADLKASGKTVAGYGASATTTTLLYHFELWAAIPFMVDDYPAKQNLFSPGCHIPVLPAEALYERRPDYVLVMAWRYYQPILQKHRAYHDKGGRFIVPLPELKVL